MKNIINQTLGILLCSMIMVSVQAQNSLNKTYSWDDQTDEVTLTMDVEPGTKVLAMNFAGKVRKGNLVVTALDPSGNSECGFCLVTDCKLSCGKARGKDQAEEGSGKRKDISSTCSSSSSNGVTKTSMSCTGSGYSYASSSSEGDFGAKGNANEVISDPEPGKWTFVIEAIKVTGDLTLNIGQE